MEFTAYFRCDAGIDHGLGHFSRCYKIANFLKKKYRIKNIFFCHYKSKEFLDKKKYKNIKIIYLYQKPFSKNEINYFSKNFNPNKKILFFVDSKSNINRYIKKLSSSFFTICLDDEKYRNLNCNVLINNNVFAKIDKYKKNNKILYLIGTKFNFIEEDKSKRPIKSKVKKIIFTFGGEDPRNTSLFFLKTLKKVLINYTVIIIIGPINKNYEKIKNFLKINRISNQISINPKNIYNYFRKGDLAISAGGVTCYELLKLGIPTIGVALNIGQKKILNYLKIKKCIEIIKVEKKKQTLRRNEVLVKKIIQNYKVRKDMSQKSKKLMKSDGIKILIENIFKFYNKNEK